MSRSVKRVEAEAAEKGLTVEILHVTRSTRTAQEAADVVGVQVDQIAKSIVFRGAESGAALLFLTAGGNRVCADKATALAGEPLEKADADFIRAATGFAIGGVSPLGHIGPVRSWFDPRLGQFDVIWAAAGTPHHLFSVAPAALLSATGATEADFTL